MHHERLIAFISEELVMRTYRVAATAAIALITFTAGLRAQSTTTEQKEKTKVELKGGKKVTVNGCLERSNGGSTPYVLTDDASGTRYRLVSDRDLAGFVDHHVAVKGRAADQGDAKVKIEQRTEGTAGQKSDAKIESSGDSTLLPYLGVNSIKAIGSSCPAR